MYQTFVQRFPTLSSHLVGALGIAIASLISSINSVAAQNVPPVCQAPNAGEYLLLVVSPTQDNQSQLRRALPNDLKTNICRYLDDTVTRIGGFSKIDDANRWARYVSNIVGLSAIITTRPSSDVPRAESVSYQPQQLGDGFAVLVDYLNRPELATQVQQVVGGDVGFVSYGQRPYLMAVYTTNQKEAYTTLEKLSDRGFYAILVNSRQVMLLRSAVRVR
jgi:hypothetical protein